MLIVFIGALGAFLTELGLGSLVTVLTLIRWIFRMMERSWGSLKKRFK